jgi:hypothetical protein
MLKICKTISPYICVPWERVDFIRKEYLFTCLFLIYVEKIVNLNDIFGINYEIGKEHECGSNPE